MSTAPTDDAVRDEEEISRAKPPFLRRVRIRNYKSITFCDVALEPLTILVGKNGSGKSNFLDAISFLRDIMELGVRRATTLRGGWKAICHRLAGKQIEIELAMDVGHEVDYRIVLGADSHGMPRIEEESGPELNRKDDLLFPVMGGTSQAKSLPVPDQSAIHSVNSELWRPVLIHLLSMTPYNFVPRVLRNLSILNREEFLRPDGSNLPGVIATTRSEEEWLFERIGQFLSAIVPEIESYDTERIADYETVRFQMTGTEQPFYAASMSDGTLRALACLVAVYQKIYPDGFPSLVAIEEPETALHPAAMRALVGAFDEAILRTQILLTTHSPDLLDTEKVRPENIRVVEMRNGSTWITPIDEASESMVRDGLSTLGGLERDRQLELNRDDLDRQLELARQERSIG